MRKFQNIRVAFAVVAVMTVAALLATSNASGANNDRAVPSVLKIAPAAPVIDQKERLAELAQRRSRVAESISSTSMLLLFSAEPRLYTNDVDYPYRQENNLYY